MSLQNFTLTIPTVLLGRNGVTKKIGIVLCVVSLLVTAGLSWLVPPMQSPDEDAHISRASSISQGDILLQALPSDPAGTINDEEADTFKKRAHQHGGRIGGWMDAGVATFVAAHIPIAREAGKRFSLEERAQVAEMQWSGTRVFHDFAGTGYYFPAIYAPQALGFAIGKQLHFSIEYSYRLARGATILCCLALLGLAFKLTRPNPLVAAILLLPMSLFQFVSPTIDGLTTSLAVLTVSLFLASIDRERKHSAAASWGLALCIFLLATSRTHLLPLLTLPFYLAWQRQSRRDFYLGCLISFATLGWVLFALQTTNDPRIVRNHTTTQILMQYAVDPVAYFKILFASVRDAELFTFYRQSFIGILGWLDTPLAKNFYPALWAGLAFCALASVSIYTLKKDWSARLLLAAIALASIGLIFLAMLATWTPHPASVIKGVQGRYFVVPAILLGYAASGGAKQQSPLRQWISGLAVTVFAFASLAALTIALLGRYH